MGVETRPLTHCLLSLSLTTNYGGQRENRGPFNPTLAFVKTLGLPPESPAQERQVLRDLLQVG